MKNEFGFSLSEIDELHPWQRQVYQLLMEDDLLKKQEQLEKQRGY